MNIPYGQTRTRIAARHALIAPDGHVRSCVPGVTGADVVILISEGMGAGFSQLLVTFGPGGRAVLPADEAETVGYVISGAMTVAVGRDRRRLRPGGFFFAPAGQPWSVTSPARGARLALFRKKFVPLGPGTPPPRARIGDAARVKGLPFLGNPDARLQVLLPDEASYDLAVNIFTYEPGATLPFVETHVMEHGLLMLGGQGIYRLEDSWYPVASGDAIWMAPYCPQWFVAMGRAPASYLYYKDVNRNPS